MKQIDITSLQGGYIVDAFNEELKKVLKNVADENTEAKAIRSITVQMKIKPDSTRLNAGVEVAVTSKLATTKPNESLVFFDVEKNKDTGEMEMLAYENSPKQLELDGLNNEQSGEGIYSMPKAAGGKA